MSSAGKQLMDLIDEEILIFGRHADYKGQYADWSSSAEAKINELLRPIIAHERMSVLELAAERELKAQEDVDAARAVKGEGSG